MQIESVRPPQSCEEACEEAGTVSAAPFRQIFEVTREGEIVLERISAMSEEREAGSFRATRIPCLVGEI